MDKQFTVHMLNGVYSAFTGDVNYKIRCLLEEHASSTNESIIIKIAGNMRGKRGGEISSSEPKYEGKGLNASFQLRECDYSGLIIEVTWSQKVSELKKKAKSYPESAEEVRTVVCFNFNDILNK